MRPSFDEWFSKIAGDVADRGDCSRRRVGAIIVKDNRHLLQTGYNGALPGEVGCLEGGCPRAASGVPAGSQYDHGPGACIALHAEANALLFAAKYGIAVEGCTMYITTDPCFTCDRLMQQAGISRVVWPEGERVY